MAKAPSGKLLPLTQQLSPSCWNHHCTPRLQKPNKNLKKWFPPEGPKKMDHPFTHKFHSQICPAGAQWSQEDILYCIYEEMGAAAEGAGADYLLAFDLSLGLHEGICEFLSTPPQSLHHWSAQLTSLSSLTRLCCSVCSTTLEHPTERLWFWLLGRCHQYLKKSVLVCVMV